MGRVIPIETVQAYLYGVEHALGVATDPTELGSPMGTFPRAKSLGERLLILETRRQLLKKLLENLETI